MNTVYKVIFNKSTGQRSVVSELARGKTKSTTRSLLATVAFGLAVSTAPALADTCAYTGNGIMSCVQTTTDENLSYVINSFVAPYHVNATKMGAEGSAQLSVSNSNIVGVGSSHALFITGKGASLELKGINSITLGSLADDTGILIMGAAGDGSITVKDSLNININRLGMVNSDAIEVYGNNTTITHSGVGTITTNGGNGILTTATNNAKIMLDGAAIFNISGNNNDGIRATSRNGNVDIESNATITTNGEGGQGIYTTANDGNISITNSGNITTGGGDSKGIFAENGTGVLTIDNQAAITTSGAASHGIRAHSKGTLKVINSGKIVTTGQNGYGIHSIINGSGLGNVVNTGEITVKQGYGILGTVSDGKMEITNEGTITTAGEMSHALFVRAVDGNAIINNNATIITTGIGASGILAAHDEGGTSGDLTINTGTSSRIETNDKKADGIHASTASYAASTGNIIISAKGTITTKGPLEADGIYAGIIKPGSTGNIDVTFRGDKIETTGAGNNHGIYALQEGSGNLTVSHTGMSISTAGAGAHGIYTVSTNASSTGTTKIDSTGAVTTIGDGANAIYAEQASTGLLAIDNTATLATSGTNAHGIYAILGKGASSDITNNGTISTLGIKASGIYATTIESSMVTLTNMGDITTNGSDQSIGIFAENTGTADVKVDSSNSNIVTTGSGVSNHGIEAIARNGLAEIILSNSKVDVSGNSAGLAAWNGGAAVGGSNSESKVTITNSTIDAKKTSNHYAVTLETAKRGVLLIDADSKIHGGAGTGRALNLKADNIELTNAGIVDAISDFALYGDTTNGTFKGTNTGTMTGYIEIIGGNVTFNNEVGGVVSLKNFGSGVKDTIDNQFGGNAVFNNAGRLELNSLNYVGTATEAILSGVKTFNHSGVISLSPTGASGTAYAGDTLAISGDFVANGGSVFIDTLLDDASSNSGIGTSDRLLLQNTVLGTGATQLFVSPMGGSQGGVTLNNGIEVVNVSRNSAAGVFTLGHDVLSGAYQYQLTQVGNNWYLTNYLKPVDPSLPDGGISYPGQIIYRPDAGIELANRESVIDMMVPGLSGMGVAPNGIGGSGAMRSYIRLGGDGDTSGSVLGQKSNSLWTFATMNNNRGKAAGDQIRYSSKSKGLQVGGDRIFAVGDGLIQAGIMTHMSSVDTKSRNVITGATARGESDGYGFGVYATWYAKANDILSPFVDTYAMYGRFKNTVKTRNNSDYSYRSNAFSFTMIGGYPLAVSSNIIVEPQAQLTYVKYGSQNHNDHGNTNITLKTKGNLIGRVGAYVYGHGYKVQPYGALNVWYDDTQSEMRYNINGGKIGADKRGAIFEAKLGFQTQATKNLTLWGEVSGRKGQNSYRDFGGAVGIKYTW